MKGLWPRQARFIARHARSVWMVCTALLLLGAVGLTQLKADGVPSSDLVLGHSEARDGQDVLAEHFPAGSGSPVYVIVPEADVAAAVDVMRRATASSRSSAVSDDSPTGQAAVEVVDGEPVYTAAGPPASPRPSPRSRTATCCSSAR